MNILSLVKFGLLIQFTHLKPSSYKDGNLHCVNIVEIKTFSGENKLRLRQNIRFKIHSGETFNPGGLVRDNLTTNDAQMYRENIS